MPIATMSTLTFFERRAAAARPALRIALSHYVTLGLSAAFGLLLISTAVHLWLGATAAAAASVGVIVAIPPDQPAPQRGKFWQLVPAVLLGPPLFFVVQLLHADALRLALLLVPATFFAFLGAAWGKRGIPIAMSVMFAMIFSMAVPTRAAGETALSMSLHFALGGVLYVGYATIANAVLNARYRVLMLADTLLATATLLRTQARQFTPPEADAAGPGPLIGRLLRQQAALADQLQAARDILLESPRTARRQQLAGMLMQLLELRDQLLACELDLDTLRAHPPQQLLLALLRDELAMLAAQVERLADALLLGRRPRPFDGSRPAFEPWQPAAGGAAAHADVASVVATSGATGGSAVPTGAAAGANARAGAGAGVAAGAGADADIAAAVAAGTAVAAKASGVTAAVATADAAEAPSARTAAGPPPGLLARGLAERVGHIHDEVKRLFALARGEAEPDLAVVRANWQMFISPTAWSWRPFAGLWRRDAPPLRHAIRAALAIAAGQAVSIALPWGTHDYWILLTITVVLRGSFAQTLERRNSRVAGTLLGCALAGALLYARASPLTLLLTVTLAQGVAHAFAVRRYLVTAVAATVLALLQAHLLNDAVNPAFEAAERLFDTLIGVTIAWAFSYVLPSWERSQIPALVARTLKAQARHAEVALGLSQLRAVDNEVELGWRLARREVYDSLSALVQATQRSLSEPRAVRPPLEPLGRLLAHSYQLLAQLAAVKSMLLLRRGRLNARQIQAPLQQAALAIVGTLQQRPAPAPAPSTRPTAQPLDVGDWAVSPADPLVDDLSPWLLRRLHLAAGIAGQLRGDADQVLQPTSVT